MRGLSGALPTGSPNAADGLGQPGQGKAFKALVFRKGLGVGAGVNEDVAYGRCPGGL